jgi:hypothetical protein
MNPIKHALTVVLTVISLPFYLPVVLVMFVLCNTFGTVIKLIVRYKVCFTSLKTIWRYMEIITDI